ncbi:MAG TPA: hypothetical protein PLW81_02070 [Thiobacillaceae bacterium]|nr:hypothetical protein [Thiobacillaceae bacterium]
MTNGISNVVAAGTVQVAQKAGGVEAKVQLNSPPQVSVPKGTDFAVVGSAQAARQAQALSSLDGQHRAADAVRHAGEAFGQIGKLLGQAEDRLWQIVKQYPPYPAESRERMELLNSLVGLRKQIDALTFPPPHREPVTLIGDSARTDGVGDVQFTMDNRQYTLHAQPVHSGAEGLDIPELGSQVSDAEVGQALGQVQLAREKLAARQAALISELDAIPQPGNEQIEAVLQSSRSELAGRAETIGGASGGLGNLS